MAIVADPRTVIVVLIRIYDVGSSKPAEQDYAPLETGNMQGRRSNDSRINDADEFELGGLDSDSDDDQRRKP